MSMAMHKMTDLGPNATLSTFFLVFYIYLTIFTKTCILLFQAMMDNNVVKVHIELHKEIKKNGSVRSLRAALSRFAKLAHMIR